MRRFAIVSLVLATCAGCFGGDVEIAQVPIENGFEVYISRTSLKSTDFEQYKLLPIGLYAECGTSRNGRPHTDSQGIFIITPETRSTLSSLSGEIFDRVRANPNQMSPKPGSDANMFDPGKFLLTIRKHEVKIDARTSFDSVEQQTGKTHALMYEFLETVRGALDKAPCNKDEFYGIGRSS